MNQYIKFIVRVLLTCFFYCLFRWYNQVLCGLEQYTMGMVLGDFYNGTLLTKFSFAWSIHCIRGSLQSRFVKLVDR